MTVPDAARLVWGASGPDYTYVRNAPTAFADPTGYREAGGPSPFGGGGGCAIACFNTGGGGSGGGDEPPPGPCDTPGTREMLDYACSLGVAAMGLACFGLVLPWAIAACQIAVGIAGGILCEALVSAACGDSFDLFSMGCQIGLDLICGKTLEAKLGILGEGLAVLVCPPFSVAVCSIIGSLFESGSGTGGPSAPGIKPPNPFIEGI